MNKSLCSLTVLLLTALLAACGSAPTRIHTLQPIPARGASSAYDGPPVRVAAVHLPADLDRIEVVSERADGELKINDLDHWAAPLGRLAQQTLSADLLARLPAGKVAFPHLTAGDSVAELRVDILRLPADAKAGVAASWQVTLDPRTERSGVVTLPDGSRSESADGVVRGLSTLLGQLADEIAGALGAGSTHSP